MAQAERISWHNLRMDAQGRVVNSTAPIADVATSTPVCYRKSTGQRAERLRVTTVGAIEAPQAPAAMIEVKPVTDPNSRLRLSALFHKLSRASTNFYAYLPHSYPRFEELPPREPITTLDVYRLGPRGVSKLKAERGQPTRLAAMTAEWEEYRHRLVKYLDAKLEYMKRLYCAAGYAWADAVLESGQCQHPDCLKLFWQIGVSRELKLSPVWSPFGPEYLRQIQWVPDLTCVCKTQNR